MASEFVNKAKKFLTQMKKPLQPVSIEGIEFDALVSENKSYTATIPTYPVEEGFPVSDTIINDPITVSMSLFLTPTPVTWMFKHQIGHARVELVCKQLEELYLSKKLVKIVTCDTIYESMGITSLEIQKTSEQGYSRQVNITAQKVRVTSKETTDIPEDVAKSGATQADAGAAATTDTADGGSYGGGETASSYDGGESNVGDEGDVGGDAPESTLHSGKEGLKNAAGSLFSSFGG